jgi:hypothetical protein
MDGTAAVGAGTTWARADHVHPTDTTRAPLASPTFTGTPAAPTPSPGDNTTKLATTAFVQAATGAYLPLTGGTLSGVLQLAASQTALQLNGTTLGGQNSILTYRNGSPRWQMFFGAGGSENNNGDNSGVNFALYRYNDSGAAIDAPITISRATGAVVIKGTSTNDSAASGNVGEYVEATLPWNSSFGLTNQVWINVLSINLSAGDWDVSGGVLLSAAATTKVYQSSVSLSPNSGNPDTSNPARYAGRSFGAGVTLGMYGNYDSLTVGQARFSLAAATTVYLVTYIQFDTSTCSLYAAHLNARRVR